jgi:FMN phosphatase YigB (HAD superfamily)
MKNKAFVFDLDGTLFETTAQEIESATGHARYIEFADVDKLLNESTPRTLVDLAREVQAEGHSVYILTARNSIIYPAIRTLLERHGVKPQYIFTVGDRGFNIPSYKAEILEQLARTHQTYFFDDDEANLDQAPLNIRKVKA